MHRTHAQAPGLPAQRASYSIWYGWHKQHNLCVQCSATCCIVHGETRVRLTVKPCACTATRTAPRAQLMTNPRSPHELLLREKPLAQAVQLLPEVHVVQLAGQGTQAPLTATVPAGQEITAFDGDSRTSSRVVWFDPTPNMYIQICTVGTCSLAHVRPCR